MLEKIRALDIERFVALLLGVFAIAELTQAMQLSIYEEFTLGPGAMPLIYGVGLLIFAVLLGLTASPKEKAPPERPDEKMDEPGRNYRAGIVTFSLLILFVVLIFFIGFLPSLIIFSFLHLCLVMRLSLLKAAVFSLLWGGGLYYAFDHLLEVQLEPGLLFG
ncbi:MAG TPA: tripartite tricarboxylate transporter TctB family protein [Dongiaceae bacterium]|nr:tripartite tricarboxylate transporter TctB family protein [Dongiaceae bacterium]